MTTPFGQIRISNNGGYQHFFSFEPVTREPAELINDYTRSLRDTWFNKRSLLDLLTEKLAPEKEFQSIDEQVDFIQRNATAEHLFDIIKENLLVQYAGSPEQQQQYCNTLARSFGQRGIAFFGKNALAKMLMEREAGALGAEHSLHFFVEEGKIFIEEKAEVMTLKCYQGNNIKETVNPDGSPLLTLKSRVHIDPVKEEYKHTHVAIHYNNSEAKNIFDARGVFEKIRDFFKSVFGMNKVNRFSLDELQPVPINVPIANQSHLSSSSLMLSALDASHAPGRQHAQLPVDSDDDDRTAAAKPYSGDTINFGRTSTPLRVTLTSSSDTEQSACMTHSG